MREAFGSVNQEEVLEAQNDDLAAGINNYKQKEGLYRIHKI